MLLSITTTAVPATDLGYLLHKNPERVHGFDLSFGHATVFYPEASPDRCTGALGAPPRAGTFHQAQHGPREFALGIESLERFVRGEPLRRVHECVFGVLALESEPVDPRL